MPVLNLRVLGSLDIRLVNGDSPAFESVKAKALLAYLAVEARHQHSRESLAGLLWPERPDSAALANLRHTLSSLRKSLGERSRGAGETLSPLLDISASTIQFNPCARAWLDLNDFQERLRAAEAAGEEQHKTKIVELTSAIELYRGFFMEGFSLKGCTEFEDWMMMRRENISLQLQRALRNLAAAHEAVGNWESALATCRQLLKYEPWDESAHRKVMALLAVHDQRSAAIAQFESCRQVLRGELGVNPEEATLRLYEQIRQGMLSFPAATRQVNIPRRGKKEPLARRGKLNSGPFVGRQSQLAILSQVLELALSGNGQVVFITGEAGSGKTRLAGEFAFRCLDLHKDLLAFAGRCNSITGLDDPYLPFREILQTLTGVNESHEPNDLPPELLHRQTQALPDAIQALLNVAPELIGTFVPADSLQQRIETIGPGRQAWQRECKQALEKVVNRARPGVSVQGLPPFNALEAFTRLLVELARHRPLVLLLDDLQWADTGSINLVYHLAHRLAYTRIVLVGIYRGQDLAAGRRNEHHSWERHPLEAVLLELQREFGEIVLDLEQSEGKAFLDALIDTEPNRLESEFRDILFHLTKGNPLFTLEMLRNMQARGEIVQDSTGKWVDGGQLDWDRLPARVEAVIAERIGRIPSQEKSILRVASVEGEAFTAEVVAEALGLRPEQVIRSLGGILSQEQQIVKAIQVGWVDSGSGSAVRLSRYQFHHILFQKYLYNRIDPVERSTLHESIGLVLENLYGPHTAEIALPLAWHFEQAGRVGRAAEYLLAAGKQAVNLSAHLQAKTLYNRCLELIHQLPPTTDCTHLEIQVQLARGAPLLTTDGWGSPAAVQAVTRAMELLEASGENSYEPEVLLALFFQASNYTAQNNMPEALARIDLLLQNTSGVERVYQVLANYIAGQVCLFSGQPVRAAEYLQNSLSLYLPEDQSFLTGITGINVQQSLLTWTSFVQWLLGYPGLASETSKQAIDLARQQAPQYSSAITIAVAGGLLSAIQNEMEQAGEYARECLRLSGESSPGPGSILGEIVLGWVEVQRGDFKSGLARLQGGVDEWQASGALTVLPLSMMLLADALSMAGQTDLGLEIVSKLMETIEQTGRRMFQSYLYWLRGEMLLREQNRQGAGRVAEPSAEVCYETAIQVAHLQQARSLELRAATSLARLLADQDRRGEAAQVLEPVLRHFTGGYEPIYLQEARTLWAELSKAA